MAAYLSTGRIELPTGIAARLVSPCYNGKMPRRSAAYHHGHLREAVLTAAAELVDEGEPLGLRELGRRVGVSHAAVHHHFPTVDGRGGRCHPARQAARPVPRARRRLRALRARASASLSPPVPRR